MELTRFRLVASDLDGTLVQFGSHTVSPAVEQTFRRLSQSGIYCTIATGRCWKETRPIAEALQITIPVIVESGALLINPCNGAVLSFQILAREVAAHLDMIPPDAGIDCFRLLKDGSYEYQRAQTLNGSRLLGKLECRPPAQDGNTGPWLKYLFIGATERITTLAQQLRVRFGSRINAILWQPEPNGESFLEVFDGSASKGRALRTLAQDLRIPMANVLTFGDNYNDFDLLAVAGMGIAIEGAPPFLLELANRVIPGPAEEGIARFFNGEFEAKPKKVISI